jgi:beta-phosphoglucomutase family hydrolase
VNVSAPESFDLGIGSDVRACLFDLDGVLTRTAVVHAAAWKKMFDAYLRAHAEQAAEAFRPFDPVAEYAQYLDGKPRYDGVRSFLRARAISLPEGDPADPPNAETVAGLGNRKNEIVQRMIATDGVEPYQGSVRFIEAARRAGLRCAVVSSSGNARQVIAAAGIEGFLDQVVDAQIGEQEDLRGKPAPDFFLEGARRLGIAPPAGAVFEDALAGVEAGRAGGFGCVVGVDRVGQASELRKHGADIVVSDLGDLLDSPMRR